MVAMSRMRQGISPVAMATLFVSLISVIALFLYLQDREVPTGSADVSTIPQNLLEARTHIQTVMKKRNIAAVSVAVMKDGEIVWAEGFGWADRKASIRATSDTRYRLASLSKPMTAAGLMVLVERGLVDLDRPANDYLGAAQLRAGVGKAADATISQLVFHTAGLPMYWQFFPAEQGRQPDMEESINKYGILVTEPGERYTYSNLGYGVLDHIISRVAAQSYGEFMQAQMFQPLGMTQTSVLPDSTMATPLAKMYNARKKEIPPYDFDHRGASAVVSNVRDLMRFAAFSLNQPQPDHQAILSEAMIDRMHRDSGSRFYEQNGQSAVDYLLGSFVGIDYGRYRLAVGSGSMPGATSRLTLVPSENLATAILCNSNNIDLWEIDQILLEAMLPGAAQSARQARGPVAPRPDASDALPAGFAGSWSGAIMADAEAIPLKLTFPKQGEVQLELNDKPAPFLRRATALGAMGYDNNIFRALFRGRINTADAKRSPHVLMLECELRQGRLTGYIAAIAINESFCLPYWMELNRVQAPAPRR